MIGKIIKGRGFRGALNYLFHGNEHARNKNAVMVATNMAGTNPRELAKEFAGLRRLRPTLAKAVCHISLSLSPDDMALNNEQFGELAGTFLNDMGFEACPFVAVRHHDTEHPHIHLLVSRINTRGEVVADKHDFQRAENIIRQIEKRYGLKAVPPSVHTQIKKRTRRYNDRKGKLPMATTPIKLTNAIDDALNDAENMEWFIKECNKREVTVKPVIDEDGKVIGLSYRSPNGQWFKASALGNKYCWPNLAQLFGKNPDYIAPGVLGLIGKQEYIQDSQMHLPDKLEKENEQSRRAVMEPEYVDRVWQLYESKLKEIKVEDGQLRIRLNNGGTIIDRGNSAAIIGLDDEQSADMLVKLAVMKSWQRVQFGGNPNFLRIAMEKAIKEGMEVVPKDTAQSKILAEVKRKLDQEKAALELTPEATTATQPDEEEFSLDTSSALNKVAGKRVLEEGTFSQPTSSRKKKRADRPE